MIKDKCPYCKKVVYWSETLFNETGNIYYYEKIKIIFDKLQTV